MNEECPEVPAEDAPHSVHSYVANARHFANRGLYVGRFGRSTGDLGERSVCLREKSFGRQFFDKRTPLLRAHHLSIDREVAAHGYGSPRIALGAGEPVKHDRTSIRW